MPRRCQYGPWGSPTAAPCALRAWSVLTDSQRPIAGRERQKGAFRATYARFAGGPRDTKSRVAVSVRRLGSTPGLSRARNEATLTAKQAIAAP